ncbi:UxaA family hydrolase [Budvicia aquatica]|uniref:UxaA family hydrolase n=1 Tax=Budvicia aquatica TaxID=82979 RepID=UPI0021019D3B|nr:UxaA family hydrolase [Budvicia aquatica]
MSNVYPVMKLNPNDDVVVARFPVSAGTVLANENIKVQSDIPEGHKISLRDIPVGQAVKRYGQIIGFASEPIKAGDHIHTHNLSMGDFSRDYAFGEDTIELPKAEKNRYLYGHQTGRRSRSNPKLYRYSDLGKLQCHSRPGN